MLEATTSKMEPENGQGAAMHVGQPNVASRQADVDGPGKADSTVQLMRKVPDHRGAVGNPLRKGVRLRFDLPYVLQGRSPQTARPHRDKSLARRFAFSEFTAPRCSSDDTSLTFGDRASAPQMSAMGRKRSLG